MLTPLAFLQNFGMFEMILIGGFGLLLFGKRLPEVGKSLGRSIVEFKKGLKGIEDEADEASNPPRKLDPPPAAPRIEQQ
jgi:sec-independent protein translocase protein TatA